MIDCLLSILNLHNTSHLFTSRTIRLALKLFLPILTLRYNKEYLLINGVFSIFSQMSNLGFYKAEVMNIMLNLFNHKKL